jgi:hypothetical protein
MSDSTLINKRRKIMQHWARVCYGEPVDTGPTDQNAGLGQALMDSQLAMTG